MNFETQLSGKALEVLSALFGNSLTGRAKNDERKDMGS
jgi:hypothetical protein